MIKATKLWMQTTKSKCFTAWVIFSQIKKQENQIKEQHKNRVKKMNEFLNIAKQRLKEKQTQEEELKMNRLTSLIDQDKILSEKLSVISDNNKSSTKNNEIQKPISMSSSSPSLENKPLEIETPSTVKSSSLAIPNKNSTKKTTKTISSIKKFKSTKPKITKADKKFCE
eukprot:jgi/Orpsp1_1/1180845/evm.model.c7180000074849.1